MSNHTTLNLMETQLTLFRDISTLPPFLFIVESHKAQFSPLTFFHYTYFHGALRKHKYSCHLYADDC